MTPQRHRELLVADVAEPDSPWRDDLVIQGLTKQRVAKPVSNVHALQRLLFENRGGHRLFERSLELFFRVRVHAPQNFKLELAPDACRGAEQLVRARRQAGETLTHNVA